MLCALGPLSNVSLRLWLRQHYWKALKQIKWFFTLSITKPPAALSPNILGRLFIAGEAAQSGGQVTGDSWQVTGDML